MALTNKGLIEYCKKCLETNTIYVYGTFGNKLTNALITSKAKQYPKQNTPYRVGLYKKALNSGKTYYAFDCVGLIKSYIWGGYVNVKYNASQDKSANGMYEVAKVKGNISTIPAREGVLVQMNGHIGVYDGKGYVYECTPNKTFAKQSHKAGGVCKTKLSDRKWTHWCECIYITYEKEQKPEQSKPTTKPVSTPTISYYPKCSVKYGSLVDALNSIKVDSSFGNRKKIAKKNGILIYLGTAGQNTKLLNLLKNGKLKKA